MPALDQTGNAGPLPYLQDAGRWRELGPGGRLMEWIAEVLRGEPLLQAKGGWGKASWMPVFEEKSWEEQGWHY